MLRSLHVGVDSKNEDAESSFTGDARLLAALLGGRGASAQLVLGPAATATRVRVALGDLVADCRSGDALVVTFATHGESDRHTQERLLLAHEQGKVSYLTDADVWAVLQPLWTKSPARVVTVVLLVDACASDGFGLPDTILGVYHPGRLLRRLIAWVSGAANPGRYWSAFSGTTAPTELGEVSLHILAAARKGRLAYATCGPPKQPEGCFSGAVRTVLAARPDTRLGALHSDVANLLLQAGGGQEPSYHPRGSATPDQPFPRGA